VTRGPRLALALATLALLPVVPMGAGPARAQEAAPEPTPAQVIGQRYQDVLDAARRLEQNDEALRKNRENGTRLARRVEALKKSPSGVMRDAQLQDALKDLRGAIAEERRLRGVAASLAIGLRIQRLNLARESGADADRLMAMGESLVLAGDLETARHRFEAAYDDLTLPVEVPRQTTQMPAEKAAPNVDLRPRGDESPDELRTLALILRDAANRSAYNAELWSGVLRRLRAERGTVAGLLDLAPPPSEARADVLARLDAHLKEVQGEIGARRLAQVRLLGEAAVLERRAAGEEYAMLKDAATHGAPAQAPAPEGTP